MHPNTVPALSRALMFFLGTYFSTRTGVPPASVQQNQPGDKNTHEKWKLFIHYECEIIRLFALINTLVELLLTITIFLSPILFSETPLAFYTPRPTKLLEITGCALLLLGSTIRLHCYSQLQQHFMWRVAIRRDHKLIQTGLYKYIRHPAYLGSIINFAGTGMLHRYSPLFYFASSYVPQRTHGVFTGVWWGVLLIEPVFVLVWGRIPNEERALEEKFGGAYREYKKRTWRLVPGVY